MYPLLLKTALQFSKFFNRHSFDKEHSFIHLHYFIWLKKKKTLSLQFCLEQFYKDKGYAFMFAVLFVHSFIHSISIHCLRCARHCSKHWKYSNGKKKQTKSLSKWYLHPQKHNVTFLHISIELEAHQW